MVGPIPWPIVDIDESVLQFASPKRTVTRVQQRSCAHTGRRRWTGSRVGAAYRGGTQRKEARAASGHRSWRNKIRKRSAPAMEEGDAVPSTRTAVANAVEAGEDREPRRFSLGGCDAARLRPEA